MSDTLKARGWYLEHRDGGHFKFYTVIAIEDGTMVTHWGKIGTTGQAKIETVPSTRVFAAGARQAHSKHAKGYEYKYEEVDVFFERKDVHWANERVEPKRLTTLFDRQLRDPKFSGVQDSAVETYDRFLETAQALMDGAASGTKSFESVMNDFDEFEAAWAAIDEKHSLTATTVSLTKQMLQTALLTGKLS